MQNMFYEDGVMNLDRPKYVLVELKFGDEFNFPIEWSFSPTNVCNYQLPLVGYRGAREQFMAMNRKAFSSFLGTSPYAMYLSIAFSIRVWMGTWHMTMLEPSWMMEHGSRRISCDPLNQKIWWQRSFAGWWRNLEIVS